MTRRLWIGIVWLLACFAAAAAPAQTLTTYSSLASYTAALPTTGVQTRVESFSSVTSDFAVSQGTPNVWNGFTLSASGSSFFGTSKYCVSLRNCLNYTPSPPASPGVQIAIDDPSFGGGTVRFVPTGRCFGFAFDYWDWNDGSQRSQLLVTLSNGTTFVVNGPTTVLGDPGGFMGFRIDTASIYAGITIASILWRNVNGDGELIGVSNVRTAEAIPALQVSKTSQVRDPANTNRKAVPGNEIQYQIEITNTGLGPPDSGTIFIVDPIPSQLSFWNGDIDAGGTDVHPITASVGFVQTNGASLSFNPATDIGFSTATSAPTSFAQCSSLAMDNSFRPDVKFLCIRPGGSLAASATGPRVTLRFRAQIK